MKVYASVITTLLLVSLALNVLFGTGHIGSPSYTFVKLYQSDRSLTAVAAAE